jgi:hypothetical protein
MLLIRFEKKVSFMLYIAPQGDFRKNSQSNKLLFQGFADWL